MNKKTIVIGGVGLALVYLLYSSGKANIGGAAGSTQGMFGFPSGLYGPVQQDGEVGTPTYTITQPDVYFPQPQDSLGDVLSMLINQPQNNNVPQTSSTPSVSNTKKETVLETELKEKQSQSYVVKTPWSTPLSEAYYAREASIPDVVAWANVATPQGVWGGSSSKKGSYTPTKTTTSAPTVYSYNTAVYSSKKEAESAYYAHGG